jgi:hypothetical protein
MPFIDGLLIHTERPFLGGNRESERLPKPPMENWGSANAGFRALPGTAASGHEPPLAVPSKFLSLDSAG